VNPDTTTPAGSAVPTPAAAPTPPVPTAATLWRWRNAVIVAFALGGVTLATWGPRMPQLRADLHLSDSAVGLLLVAVTAGSIAGLSASSALLSRLGARRTIRAMLWLIAAGIAALGIGAGWLHAVPVAAVAFVVVGAGIGALDVSINVEGAAVERAAGRTLMPLLHAAWSAGAIIGAGTGAACAALGVTPQQQFLGEAVVIAVVAAVAARAIPDVPLPTAAIQPRPLPERLRSWARGWADWRLLLIGLVMLGVELGEGSANSWLTLAVRDDHHHPDAVAALFFVAFAAAETLARVLGGPLVDRLGRVRTVRLTTAAGVLGVLLFITAGPAWLVLLGTVLWAVGVSMGFPLGMSAAAESGPDAAARVSVVASIGYLANLAGPPAVGFLAQSFGLLNALWLLAALLAVAFAASGILRTQQPPRQDPA